MSGRLTAIGAYFSPRSREQQHFLGVALGVQVEAPDIYISAEQIGSTTIDLQEYFDKQFNKKSLPLKFLTPKVNIENITLVSDPGSYYSFAMNLIPGRS